MSGRLRRFRRPWSTCQNHTTPSSPPHVYWRVGFFRNESLQVHIAVGCSQTVLRWRHASSLGLPLGQVSEERTQLNGSGWWNSFFSFFSRSFFLSKCRTKRVCKPHGSDVSKSLDTFSDPVPSQIQGPKRKYIFTPFKKNHPSNE